MKKKLLYLLLVFICGSCAIPQMITYYTTDSISEIDKIYNTWIGYTELDIIRKFGTPDNSYEDGSNNKTLQFRGKSIQSSSGQFYNNMYKGTSSLTTYHVNFLLDKYRKVVSQTNNYPKLYKNSYYQRKETKAEAKARVRETWKGEWDKIKSGTYY